MHQVTLSDQNYIYSEVYLNSFDPNNACTNYLADGNLGPLYQVTVPGNATIFVVVEEFTEGAGCPSYTVTVCYGQRAGQLCVAHADNEAYGHSNGNIHTASYCNSYVYSNRHCYGYLDADSNSYRNVNGNCKCDCGAEQCRFPMSPKGSESREKV